MRDLKSFKQIWLWDFEYKAAAGENPIPHCVVAREINSGVTISCWCEKDITCPFPTGDEVLFVSYNATAEISCHLVLGWPVPINILDLFAEHKRILSGRVEMKTVKLLMTMDYYDRSE